jgi:transcription elongation factor SPT6
MSITGQESLHFPEDHHELPLTAAEKFTSARFQTAGSVLDAARNMISHEISVNPTLRAFIRRIFMADAVITVTATDKGMKEIQPGHPHYVHLILTTGIQVFGLKTSSQIP